MRRDLIALPNTSKVWIYQSDKLIDYDTSENIKSDLYEFTMKWVSHGHALDSYANLFHHQFIVVVADSSNLPSGCSIDASVHFLEALGKQYNIDFFNRMIFSYMEDDIVHTVTKNDFKSLYANQTINDETLVFDNLVNNKADFLEYWIKPLNESWHKKFV